jgi:hypothetical protein
MIAKLPAPVCRLAKIYETNPRPPGGARKYETNPRRAVLGHHSKIRNEPKISNSKRLDGRFDIGTIFVRAVAAEEIRGSDAPWARQERALKCKSTERF